MLKLLKYELIGSYRQYVLSFVVFLLLCLISPLLPMAMRDAFAGIMIAALAGIMLSIFINIIMSFNKSMFKKPGYLTLTLPVSTNQIVGSKVIGSILWSFVGMLVLILGGGILAVVLDGIEVGVLINGIQSNLAEAGKYIGETLGGVFTSLTTLMVLILSFYFTITVTQTKYIPKYKAAIGIIGYFVALILVAQLFNSPFINDFTRRLDYTGYLIFNNVCNIIVAIVLFVSTVYLIDHKIEVE